MLVTFLIVIALSSLVLVSDVNASNSFHGILTSDATWSKANSPYALDGPTAVNNGVTITVDPGVTLNLNGYYLQVNGTLIASGTDTDKIYFNGGSVTLTSVSSSSSVIQNAIFTDGLSVGSSAKITKCSLNIDVNDGSPTVTYNSIGAINANGGSPIISNNDITGNFLITGGSATISANTIHSRPWDRKGSPTFTGNKLYDGIGADSSGGLLTVINNELYSSNNYPIIYVQGINAVITNNKIVGANNNPNGLSVHGILSTVTVSQNQIYGCNIGFDIQGCFATVAKNVVFNNKVGLNMLYQAPITGASGIYANSGNAVVEDNSIANNAVGIQYSPYGQLTIIKNNNFQDNSEYFLKLQSLNDLTIGNNWWGTTDTAAINQKIYDNKNDFNLGKVTVNPILMAPDSQAPAIPTDLITLATPVPTAEPTANPTQLTGTSTPIPTQNPTATSNQPGTSTSFNGIEVAILAVLIVIAVLLGILIVTLRRKRAN